MQGRYNTADQFTFSDVDLLGPAVISQHRCSGDATLTHLLFWSFTGLDSKTLYRTTDSSCSEIAVYSLWSGEFIYCPQ